MKLGKMWREENSEIADSKISLHDKYRFEIKLDIDLPPASQSAYKIETFFFVPKSLNISPQTYNKHKFYNRVQQFIRFKTPKISLKKIVDPVVDASPYNRIHHALPALLSEGHDKVMTDRVYNEIKLLGAVIKASVADMVKFLIEDMNTLQKEETEGRLKDFERNGLEFSDDTHNLIHAIGSLKKDLLNPAVPQKLREAFLFCDEFISVTIQDNLSILLEVIRENPTLASKLTKLDESLTNRIKKQQKYRDDHGYPSILKKDTRNTLYPYRKSVLKKFISSSLHLNIEISEWEGWIQFFFGIAAAVAMLFAVLVTIYAQNRFTQNSAVFVTVLVVSYVFKDRIKDWLKLFFSKSIIKWLADRKVKITDPYDNRMIGFFKEAFSFIDYKNVPPDILHKRNMDNITSIDEDGKPERVMRHEKEVILFPQLISKHHVRRKNIIDIMRLNISDFLLQADDSQVDFLYLNPENNHLEHLPCQRVYHINMVIKYTSRPTDHHSLIHLERIRLILNRDGIVSIEEVKAGV